MKEIMLVLGIIFSISLVSSQFVYDNPTLPKINQANASGNITSGQIPANTVNKTTGTYFDYQLMDSIIDQLYVLISTGTNATFINDTYVPYLGASKDVNLGNHNLTASSLLVQKGGQVNFDSSNLTNSYFVYNDTSKRLELWVNHKIQQDWGNSTTIYGKATFQSDAFFQNLSGVGLLINTNVLVIGNVTSENIFAGNVCYSDGTNCTFINTTLSNLTNQINNINQSLYNYIFNVNQSLYNSIINVNQSLYNSIVNVNQSLFNQIYNINQTLTNLSKVNTYFAYINVTTSGGIGGGISVPINFIISRITVTPSSPSTKYHFKAILLTSSVVIDQDRMLHVGTWDIYNTNAVSNDRVVANITGSNPDDLYTIKITYSNNFQ